VQASLASYGVLTFFQYFRSLSLADKFDNNYLSFVLEGSATNSSWDQRLEFLDSFIVGILVMCHV